MPLIVVFGFILTVLVFFSFFGVCIYICFQCYEQGFSEADRTGGRENGETAAAVVAMDPEELNREIESAVEKLTKPPGENDDEEEPPSELLSECAICLEEFGDRASCRVFPNCKHMFHTNCIISWLGLNRTCPICRTRL